MLKNIISFIVGNSQRAKMKEYWNEVRQINQIGEKLQTLPEGTIRDMTETFRRRLANGETLADIKLEAFAVVREACRRLKGSKWLVRGKELTWEIVPYDVQLIGGLVLNDGHIAEMATGEGKTLVAVAPLYLNALAGKGAHLVTVNDYLAQRDAEWMGGVFNFLGMSVGVIISDMEPARRRAAYNCDVTYGTNNEFGFDYLRDNMAIARDYLVQREHTFAIIDEVDSVLIDEARTPLIISGQVDRDNAQYERLNPAVEKIVRRQFDLVNELMGKAREMEQRLGTLRHGSEEHRDLAFEYGKTLLTCKRGLPKHKALTKALQDVDNIKMMERAEREVMLNKAMREVDETLYYVVDEKGHSIDLTERGRDALSPTDPEQFLLVDLVEEFAAIENRPELDEEEKTRLKTQARQRQEEKQIVIHAISQLLRAHSLYERDVDYLVDETGKVVIIDEHTGRQMPGRRWSDGLHQAVEAKERVKVEAETQTLATITLQNFFRMYGKLAGMTGTAETEALEFAHTYKMDVYVIPTNRPIMRVDEDDIVFRTKREKFNAVIEEVERLHQEKLPVLVGTKSVEVSELLSKMLKRRKISHNVLNAKYHERESEIVAEAGQPGAVTIATNMAGRGTDIKLGPGVVRESGGKREGGLQIIGTERHDSRRIDRQLRGRAGRQGDPGRSRFFVSLEDDLMRLFGSDRIGWLMRKMGMQEGEVIQHRWITRSIESAQKKIESRNFEIRKRTLEYDDVMNKQRAAIYGLRRRALMATTVEELRDILMDLAMEGLDSSLSGFTSDDKKMDEWDVDGFLDYVERYCPYADLDDVKLNTALPASNAYDDLLNQVEKAVFDGYEKKRRMLRADGITAALTRRVILMMIDQEWRDHLAAMDDLRESVWTASYEQKEPLVVYQRLASQGFQELMDNIHRLVFQHYFLTEVVVAPQMQAGPRVFFQKQSPEEYQEAERQRMEAQANAGQPAGEGGEATGASGAPPRVPRPATVKREAPKVGRNDPCPCGSGKKYKNCHGAPNRLAGTMPIGDKS